LSSEAEGKVEEGCYLLDVEVEEGLMVCDLMHQVLT
jgi:hypothetical protein